MLQSKYVVVEVSTTTATMTLVQYLITHGFDKFAVVSDLCDHPSLKYKTSINGTTTNGSSNANTATNSSSSSSSSSTSSTSSSTSTNGKPKVSINDIAQALSKRSSPSSDQSNGFSNSNTLVRAPTPSTPVANNHSALTKILEDKSRQTLEQQKEQERQQLEIQRIILGHVASVTETEERVSPEINEFDSIKKDQNDEDTEVKTESSDSVDFGLGTSDEQVRASMIHLLNPVLGSAFGSAQIEETNSRRRSDYSPATKKHRWMTNGELEESRFGRGKNYGRVHCKATYKCALCGKPTTLNSTGSRWNLLRHVIMIHSESKPYQCFDCDFNGIKSNVISHARQSGHRCDDAFDITTDEMRAEWNAMLHACFPDYVKAKTRGWQSEEIAPKETSTTENEVEA